MYSLFILTLVYDNRKLLFYLSDNSLLLREITQRKNDKDSDGVINSIDLCPSTSLGFQVDETGCSLRIDPSQLV